MDARLQALLAAFDRASEGAPADLVFALQRLAEPGALPSPWETWTLIGLARHRRRQFWVAAIIQTRLQGTPSDLAAGGALGHPEGVPQLGPVPGMPEWEYYFHGRGCCITHKVDGDQIDVDFYDDTAEYFDTSFYKNYLDSLRSPEQPEKRLRELHPSARAITLPIADLLKAGALTPLDDHHSHPCRLADEVVAALDAIDAFCSAWADPEKRVWLAALIGDWLGAHKAAAGRPELTVITAPRAEQCRELWLRRLRRDVDVPFTGADALRALADLQAPDLEDASSSSPRPKMDRRAPPHDQQGILAPHVQRRRNLPAWRTAQGALQEFVTGLVVRRGAPIRFGTRRG